MRQRTRRGPAFVRERRVAFAAAALVFLAGGGVGLLAGSPAGADVVRDGRVGSAGPGAVATEADVGGGLRYLIRESDGERAGQNLFHSFSRMDLDASETAVYQGDAGVRNLITTVTGGRSSIDGRIRSEIPGANLYLINPDGVVFGENARVDLTGAFTVSTADQLIFSNGDEVEMGGAPPTLLSVADPVGFGFLDAPAPISVEGSRIRLRRDQSLGFFAGELELRGGRSDGGTAYVATQSGRLDLVSLASAGRVFREADGIRVEGDPRFADVTIADEMVVTTSGLDLNPLAGLFVEPGYGSGAIFVRADDFLIRDAELRTLTVTSHAASDIEIDLSGGLTIESVSGQAQSGIFADTGYRTVPASGQVVTNPFYGLQGWAEVTIVEVEACGVVPCAIRYRASGRAGDVRIRARDVSLRNGGKITARSEFSGDAGTIDIEFRDEMSVVGRRGPGDVSLITTNANGTGDPGTIRIRSDSGTLRLDENGALVIQNSENSLATSTPGRIEVDVAELELAGDARIDSSTRGAGPGGVLDITARDRITLAGRTSDESFTGISTLSQPESTGPAGEIRIATAELLMTDGAEISARPADATSQGAAGNLGFEIGDRLVMRDATISTESPNAAGGNIALGVSGVVDMLRSSITTSVTSGPESGGNVTLRPGPGGGLVLDHSQIVARADAGAGGRIDLEAGVVIVEPNSAIDASSTTGIDGVVLINGVEGRVVPEVVALATPSVDASSLLREPCAARRPGASNRFVVDERPRVSPDAGDYLAAPLASWLAPESADAKDGLGADSSEPATRARAGVRVAQADPGSSADCTN